MKLQLIRNATLRLEYAGATILIDPMLGPRHSISSFAGIEENPTTNLPMPVTDVLKNIDLLLISHLHQDHFDPEAQEIIDKSLTILCQPDDQETISKYGFINVAELIPDTQWEHIKITRTCGQHGTGRWAERLNPVSGFVFEHPGEPTVYWIGDSIWCEEVQQALDKYQPGVVVTHSGGAELDGEVAVGNRVQRVFRRPGESEQVRAQFAVDRVGGPGQGGGLSHSYGPGDGSGTGVGPGDGTGFGPGDGSGIDPVSFAQQVQPGGFTETELAQVVVHAVDAQVQRQLVEIAVDGLLQRLDLSVDRSFDGNDDELGDSIAMLDCKGVRAVVDQQHLDLAAVVLVDGPGGVEHGDAPAGCEARPGSHLPFVACR